MNAEMEIDDNAMDLYVVLPCGAAVQKVLYDELRRQVEAVIPTLRPGVSYRIQHLVTAAFWMPLSRYVHIQLGRCLASWVVTGEVDLDFVGCPLCNSKRYRPK
jgi:hypothetical protein